MPQPTFANTIEALDDAGELLDKVQGVFFNLTGAETNDRLAGHHREAAPLLSALHDDMVLNRKLFARVKEVWEQREQPEAQRRQSGWWRRPTSRSCAAAPTSTREQKQRCARSTASSPL